MSIGFKPVKAVLFDMDGLLLGEFQKKKIFLNQNLTKSFLRHGAHLRKGFQGSVREIWQKSDAGSASEAAGIDGEAVV